MSLTMQEKEQLMQVLNRTGGQREVNLRQRVIPEEYASLIHQVEREELTLALTEVPVRCVITKDPKRAEGCPVHVNLHGGGFVHPQDADDDRYCARVALGIRGIVVDVDYAVCPDYVFPVAFDQCYAVVKWAFSQCAAWNADPGKVSLGGHSAGGDLTAAISIKAAQTGDFKLCMQVLDYAANDNYMPLITEGQERSAAFSMLYADGDPEKLKNPLVSPVYATPEQLKNQPRTVIVEAGICPFRDVNRRYAQMLIEAGTEVWFLPYPGSLHGFTVRLTGDWDSAQKAIIRALNTCGK